MIPVNIGSPCCDHGSSCSATSLCCQAWRCVYTVQRVSCHSCTFNSMACDCWLCHDSAADQALVRNVRYIIGAGIIFRMKDNNNYYMFRLAGEEGAVLGKMVNGVWVDIDNPRSIDFLPERVRFSQANWYALKVVCNGDRITCYINDSVVVNKTDTQFSLGRFGLCTFKTRADFDFFKVYQ